MDVLIVDDDPICLKVLTLMLSKKNCNVVTAASAEEAKQKIAQQAFQIVFTDLGLPDVEDREFIKYLCQHKNEFSVVVISGHILEETAQPLLDLGVAKLLEKPVYVKQVDEIFAEVVL